MAAHQARMEIGMKKILAASAAAALLVGGGTAFGAATFVESPEQADYSVERSADVRVEIMAVSYTHLTLPTIYSV